MQRPGLSPGQVMAWQGPCCRRPRSQQGSDPAWLCGFWTSLPGTPDGKKRQPPGKPEVCGRQAEVQRASGKHFRVLLGGGIPAPDSRLGQAFTLIRKPEFSN